MQILEKELEFHVIIPFNHWSKRNQQAVKDISGRRWDAVKKIWIIPLNKRIEVIKLAKKCRAEILKIDDNSEMVVGELPKLADLKIDLPIKATLRPYQKNGVAQAMKLKRCIIGDEQGLGKAQPLYSKVATLEGWKEMREIEVGDIILA